VGTEAVKLGARSEIAVAVTPRADNFRKVLLVCEFDMAVLLARMSSM
jgi:hypothetical protein